MIKVIKHGQTKLNATCGRCGCEFTYEYEDIQSEAVRGLTNYRNTRYVKCPDCGNLIYLTSYSDWPDGIEPIPCSPAETNKIDPCKDCDWMKKLLGGITYVGDTPCTWCNKGPYKVTCDSISTQGILNDCAKIKCDNINKEKPVK